MTRRGLALALVLVLASASSARAGAYVFGGEGNGIDVVTHPSGYSGTGGLKQMSRSGPGFWS